MVRHMAAMDEYIAQYILTGLLANAGVNAFTGGIGTVAGNNTLIAPQYWDANAFGYFDQVARLNKFRKSLWHNRQQPLSASSGAHRKMLPTLMEKALPLRLDRSRCIRTLKTSRCMPRNRPSLFIKGSVAFINKAWNPSNAANAENKAGNYWLWSEASRNLPGVTYDIIMQQTCPGMSGMRHTRYSFTDYSLSTRILARRPTLVSLYSNAESYRRIK